MPPRVRFRLPQGCFCEAGLLLVLLARALPPTSSAATADNIWLAEISRNSINITPISTCFTKNARVEGGPVAIARVLENAVVERQAVVTLASLYSPRHFPPSLSTS